MNSEAASAFSLIMRRMVAEIKKMQEWRSGRLVDLINFAYGQDVYLNSEIKK